MAAIDTRKPGIRTGNFAPCRAGGFVGNHLIHSSFIPAKSVSSRMMTVALTTRSSEVPAALRMADTFSRHCRVCSWIVSPTIFPVTGSCGPVPETNTRPAARTAWLYVADGAGAFGVRIMSLAIKSSSAEIFVRIAFAVSQIVPFSGLCHFLNCDCPPLPDASETPSRRFCASTRT
jgi:hypothetical protein